MLNTQPNEPATNVTQAGNRNATVTSNNTGILNTGDNNTITQIIHELLPLKHVQVENPSPNFVGREREITQLIAALTSTGQAAICNFKGMGGIGKSELALKVAQELREHFTDQWMLNFRSESEIRLDARDALTRCINDFGGNASLNDDDDAMLKSKYRSTLSGRRALLILDNINHPDQISLFERLPGCALLVTSREAKSHYGEVIDLDELSEIEAVAMLQKFTPRVSEATAKTIVELCGYLPLAIEAIGAYLENKPRLSPEKLAEDLAAEKHRLLEKIDRASQDYKNLSVTASLNISYQGLNEAQQRALHDLSVFPATFDATAAKIICRDEENTLLDELAKRSLVRYNSAHERFYLHDLVRVFANNKSNADEHRAVQMRFALYYCCVAIGAQWNFESPDIEAKQQALYRFHDERENIFAGQEWTARQTDNDAMWCCSKYALVLADFLLTGMLPSIPILEAGLKAAQQLGDRHDEARHLSNLGTAYYAFDEIHKSISFHEQALVISREIGNRRGEVADLGNLGNSYFKVGDNAKAIEMTKQALGILQEIEPESHNIFKLQGQLDTFEHK